MASQSPQSNPPPPMSRNLPDLRKGAASEKMDDGGGAHEVQVTAEHGGSEAAPEMVVGHRPGLVPSSGQWRRADGLEWWRDDLLVSPLKLTRKMRSVFPRSRSFMKKVERSLEAGCEFPDGVWTLRPRRGALVKALEGDRGTILDLV
ncbi:hypothetical protein Dimus_022432 [Dionaea muscipula]